MNKTNQSGDGKFPGIKIQELWAASLVYFQRSNKWRQRGSTCFFIKSLKRTHNSDKCECNSLTQHLIKTILNLFISFWGLTHLAKYLKFLFYENWINNSIMHFTIEYFFKVVFHILLWTRDRIKHHLWIYKI